MMMTSVAKLETFVLTRNALLGFSAGPWKDPHSLSSMFCLLTLVTPIEGPEGSNHRGGALATCPD